MSFLLNLLVYLIFFALLVHFGDKAEPILKRAFFALKVVLITLVVRLFLGFLIGIPFYGIGDLIRELNRHSVSGGQIAQGLAFEFAWIIVVCYFTIESMKKLKWIALAAGLFLLACVLRVSLPSTHQLLASRIRNLDSEIVNRLTPDQFMVMLCGDIEDSTSGRFKTQAFSLVQSYKQEANNTQSNEEFVSLTKQFKRDLTKLLYLEEEAKGSKIVYGKRYLRFRLWPKVAELAGHWERFLLAILFSLIFGYFIFPKIDPRLADYTKATSIITFFVLIIGLTFLSGTPVGNVLNNIPQVCMQDFTKLLSTPQGVYKFLAAIAILIVLAMLIFSKDKDKSIGGRIVFLIILFLIVGFFWNKFSKPAPPPPVPLYKAGYRLIDVPGPLFSSGDNLRIKVDRRSEGRIFTAHPTDQSKTDREVFSATWPMKTSHPLQLWVKGNEPVIIGYVTGNMVGVQPTMHTL